MTGLPSRWEHGSEYHALFGGAGTVRHPWDGEARYLGCGRDALRAILAEGRAERGLRRLWVPGFFCQEVVASLLTVGLPVLPYPALPQEAEPDLGALPLVPGDAVLRVELFGLQSFGLLGDQRKAGVEYLEDHTHDPWCRRAWTSDADYCVASLRKTVPVPDGGVLWSPLGRQLPPEPPLSPERRLASLEKFAAMLLKAAYLRGEAVGKELYRSLALEGEAGTGLGPPSGMTPWSRQLMAMMPLDVWREQRRLNHRTLVEALSGLPGAAVLEGLDEEATCPFFAVLVFDHPEDRDHVRKALLAANIYPGTHWPMTEPALEGLPEASLHLSRRILTLHCDLRYDGEDLLRVAAEVRKAILAAHGTQPSRPR